ncbi:MAG TPA: CsbD family protein [Planctomycetia bacterium]|nr:CsbD family protein [Planctomycetia bacterium]
MAMDWSQLEGQWDTLKGHVKERWGKITDDDVMRIEGKGDRLAGLLQQKYGLAKDKAETEISDWVTKSKSMVAAAKETVSDAVEKGKEYVEKGKEYVANTSVADMATDVRDMIGRHPIPAALVALGIGYFVGRMIASSSNRS